MSGPTDNLDVLVIGAGQAGLAMGHHLTRTDARFLLVDAAAEVGDSWRRRWDSLQLFTPAQYDNLPGLPFPATTTDTLARTTSRTTCTATSPSSTCRSCSTPPSPR